MKSAMDGILYVGLIFAVGALYTKREAIADTVVPMLPTFEKYDALFKKYSRTYYVPWRWLKAIAMNESSLGQDPRVLAGAVSSDGLSYGLMQVTLTTANDLRKGTTPADLNNPEISVELAARYLAQMLRMFRDDKRKAVMSYNQGPGNTQKGKEYAAEYYNRFERNLARILEKQPGNEKEIG